MKTNCQNCNNLCLNLLENNSNTIRLLGNILNNLIDCFGVKNGSMYLLMENKYRLICNNFDTPIDYLEISPEEERILTSTESILEKKDLVYFPSFSKFSEISLFIPLSYNNNLFGFIFLSNKKDFSRFSESEKASISFFSNFISKMLFSSESYIKSSGKKPNELYLKVFIEPVSGVYNNIYIEQRLIEETKEALRYKKDFSFSLIAIDNYKEIIEKYGKQAINSLMQKTGSVINSFLRKDIDIVGKYHDNSFLILLPSTDVKGAIIFSERLKNKLSDISILIRNASNVFIENSIGVTSIEGREKDTEQIILKLEEAVKNSRKMGNNRISYNYSGIISENISDFEKAMGISANLLRKSIEDFFITDENGNEINFTQASVNKAQWYNIPRKK